MESPSNQQLWWGYVHVNRHVQAKRYFSPDDVNDAYNSPFVRSVIEPFYANGREEAIEKIKQMKHDGFVELGKHFGYPDCCIEWFNDRFFGTVPFELTEAQDKVNNSKGFIPCPTCADRVHSGEIKIEELITNREHPVPYPKEDREYMSRVYGC